MIVVTVATGGIAPIAGTGFWIGAANGAIMGASTGFISGFAKEILWEGGNDYKKALKLGGKSALMGAIFGGILGGTFEGISAVKNGKDFWTGKYTYSSLAKKGIYLNSNKVAEADLNSFINQHFSGKINGMAHKPSFKVENFTDNNGRTYLLSGDYSLPGPSRIELSRTNAFTDELSLYSTIDHELVHADLLSDGTFANWFKSYGYETADNLSEYVAYQHSYTWSLSQNITMQDKSWYLEQSVKYWSKAISHLK
jgi:hypothetical protein